MPVVGDEIGVVFVIGVLLPIPIVLPEVRNFILVRVPIGVIHAIILRLIHHPALKTPGSAGILPAFAPLPHTVRAGCPRSQAFHAGWRRPPPFEVCDVPKGHAAAGSSIQPIHAANGCVVPQLMP